MILPAGLELYLQRFFKTKPTMIDKNTWVPIKDRKVLFALSHGQELFYCVGGKREPGESDEEALLREVLEEVAVNLDPSTIRHVKTFIGPSHMGGEMSMAIYDAKQLPEQE